MIKIKKTNKILAIILLVITIFSIVEPVLAVSGTGKFVGGQYASGMKTTDNQSSSTGVLIRKLINNTTGEKMTVFCAEHLVDFKSNVSYDGEYYTPTDENVKRACKVAYFGWYSKYPEYVVDGGILTAGMKTVKEDYVFSQQMIWEVLGQSNATFIDSEIQGRYINFKNDINSKIDNMQRKPSFCNETITVDVGENILTDTNGVLANYTSIDKTIDGIRIVHNKGENTMTITINENCSRESYSISEEMMKNWGMIKDETRDNDTTVYFSFKDGIQNQLYAMHYNDPVAIKLDLKINLLGNLELNKLNTNGDLINGAVFNVTGVNGFNRDVEVTNGKILIEKIQKGIYFVKEKSSPNGYLLNTETYKVEVKPNETATQAIVNNEPTGEITITKIDIDTGNSNRIDGTSHHGDVNINGAEYTLYASSDIYNKENTIKYFSKDEEIAKFTFNEYGVASVKITNNNTPAQISAVGSTLTGLPMGNFYAIETVVPLGYTKDINTYTYTLSYKDSNTEVIKTSGIVKNTVQKAPFRVIKVTTNDNTIADKVEGAEFTAILTKYVDFYGSFEEARKHLEDFAKDEYSIFKTGSDGSGVSGLLAYGNYTVNETYTPSPEIETVEQFYVTIDKDSKTPIKELVANDLPFQAYIKMQKQDKNTGKLVTYSNATFELYKLNKDTKEWEQVQCKVGDKYYKTWTTNSDGVANTETKIEAGNYKLSEVKVPQGFIQLDEELIFKVDNRNSTLNYDKDLDAWITVIVENEQPKGTLKLQKKVNLREDINKTMIEEINFSKISFELVADEDIIDYADKSIIYEKGKVIGKYNLNADGSLIINNINMGKYHLKELTTIKGAVLDETEYKVVFEQTDTKTKEYVVELNIENQTTCMEFSKTDITGEKELVGAKLTVTDENGKIVDSWVSSEKSHKIEGLEVGKTFTLTEEIAPDTYVKATSIKFKVESKNEIQKVVMIDKVVEVTKSDLTTGEELEGAELKVVDEDNNIIDEWTSTKQPHKVTGLQENKNYKLIEVISPYGFELAEEISFFVTEDKQTQKIEMKDKAILNDIKVVKIDNQTKEIIKEKFTFAMYEDMKCTKLIREVESNREDGFVIFDGVRYGTFYIKETKAPKNYELSDRIAKVEISDKGVFVDDIEIQGDNSIYSFEFENQRIETPKTGDERNIILAVIISIISFLGLLGVFIRKITRKNK